MGMVCSTAPYKHGPPPDDGIQLKVALRKNKV